MSAQWSWAEGEGRLPTWLPRTRTVSIPCGLHFQAIRVPAPWAKDTHNALGPHSGGVLANDLSGTWVFLLDLGAVAPGSWNLHGTRLVRERTAVEVPPAYVVAGRDVRWAVRPGQGTTTVKALTAALAARPGASRTPVGGRQRRARS